MSIEENKSLIRHAFGEIYRGNADAIDRYFTPDFVCYTSSMPEPIRGLEANKQMLAYFQAGFSDIRYDAEDMLAEGDRVTVRWAWSMRHTGLFEGIPPTGREVTGASIEIFRIENGQIAEQWAASDNLSFMKQLGALPVASMAEPPGL